MGQNMPVRGDTSTDSMRLSNYLIQLGGGEKPTHPKKEPFNKP